MRSSVRITKYSSFLLEKKVLMVKKCLDMIDHHYQHCGEKDKCEIIACKKIARLDLHTKVCRRVSCSVCKQFASLLKQHSVRCTRENCRVLNCEKYKKVKEKYETGGMIATVYDDLVLHFRKIDFTIILKMKSVVWAG
jgi:hypothetical protein